MQPYGIAQLNPVTFDMARFLLIIGTREVRLSRAQWDLLFYLGGRPGRLVSCALILDAMHGIGSDHDERIIRDIIKRLRAAGVDWITTRRGFGYAWDAPRPVIVGAAE